jgi:hypothetical protein
MVHDPLPRCLFALKVEDMKDRNEKLCVLIIGVASLPTQDKYTALTKCCSIAAPIERMQTLDLRKVIPLEVVRNKAYESDSPQDHQPQPPVHSIRVFLQLWMMKSPNLLPLFLEHNVSTSLKSSTTSWKDSRLQRIIF